ncbi:MAG: hypothetical protein LH702_25380 [Phormidesmis sp. CAN_BIN44]|nr:hypothetical protein [Phormidesmis sp. CAN_BIN44]
MPIQSKKHEVTVGMIIRVFDFYKKCLPTGEKRSAVAIKECIERFDISKVYVGQAIKIRPYLSSDNQELGNLLDGQKISADTCLTIIQCFDANQDRFSSLSSMISDILQDEDIKQKIERGRLSKGCFVKWRDKKGLKLRKSGYRQESKATIDEDGKLIIPDKYLRVLGLRRGDEVTLRLKSGRVHILVS